jgi:hypothetical protein
MVKKLVPMLGLETAQDLWDVIEVLSCGEIINLINTKFKLNSC